MGREEGAPAPPAPRPPSSSPSARRTPAGAARGSTGPGPRGQLSAVSPWLEGPAGEGRRRRRGRLQEVRAAAQREAAERTAERGHGWGDEETAPAAPAAGVPRPGCCSHSNCREAPASEPALDPHVTPSRTLHARPPGGTPGFVVCREQLPKRMPGVAVLADYEQDACLVLAKA